MGAPWVAEVSILTGFLVCLLIFTGCIDQEKVYRDLVDRFPRDHLYNLE